MVSEKEIEARAVTAFVRALSEPGAAVGDQKPAIANVNINYVVRAALSAAALARAEDNAEGGEPEGELCKCAPAFHEHDEAGAKHCRSCDAEWHPAPQPSVKVKPLEWKKPKELRFRAACTHFGYEYFIDQTPNGWLLQTYLFGDEYWETLGSYPALDDAMYAAQADYERRILSALTSSKPETETVNSVLLDAVRKIASTDLSGCADMTTAEIFGALSRMHETAAQALRRVKENGNGE